jgi:chitinase
MPKSSWPDHKVIGYYGIDESKFMGPSAVPWNLLTHVCFAFASIGSDYSVNITSGTSLMSTVFSTAIANGVKPILSIGGWGYGSSMYSAMVSSNDTRALFIQSLRGVVNDYNITGVDLDWEYPGRESDESVPYNETTDVPNVLVLLDELRTEFGQNLTLSAAVAATVPFADDVSGFAELFDWIGLMVYDFATGPLNDTTSNAPLTGDVSGESGVAAWFNAGLPKSKMVFGIPSYGRSFTLTDVHPPFSWIMLTIVQFPHYRWFSQSMFADKTTRRLRSVRRDRSLEMAQPRLTRGYCRQRYRWSGCLRRWTRMATDLRLWEWYALCME